MKALFLAGGKGTRLKPLTNKLPKPMIPIMTKPLLERNIAELKKCNIDEIVLSVCYKPQHIRKYFEEGNRQGVKIHYVKEDVPLGTGGAIKNTEKFYDNTFLIFNSDILSDIDFKDMIEYHKSKKADVTIAVTAVRNPTAYGVIEYDENNYAKSFVEKPSPNQITSNYINAGIYIFEPKVLKEIPNGKVVSVEKEIFPMLLKKGYKIAVYDRLSYWMDVGTPKKYLEAHKDIMTGKCKIPELDIEKSYSYRGKNVKFHSNVKIVEPVYIGDNVEIGANTTIGPNAVIGNNCYIGTGSKITGSILWDNVNIGSGSRLYQSIMSSNCIMDGDSDYYNTIYTPDHTELKAI
ncbi:MAG: NDP-sugar synthase [Clostridium sp.]|uniref:sugar phosphate nucleotidyltransferase n=1 Tax=Clostridium sp. TaxID=1506 RepID=UPI0039EA5F03